MGRVSVGLISNNRRLRRLDGGEEIEGEFAVAGGDPGLRIAVGTPIAERPRTEVQVKGFSKVPP